ncbi:MAG: asparaginase, partial [Candidatus Omnitrophica bacterium]|nr:asparaginase [Candidatus Omnitrophota bacterium]
MAAAGGVMEYGFSNLFWPLLEVLRIYLALSITLFVWFIYKFTLPALVYKFLEKLLFAFYHLLGMRYHFTPWVTPATPPAAPEETAPPALPAAKSRPSDTEVSHTGIFRRLKVILVNLIGPILLQAVEKTSLLNAGGTIDMSGAEARSPNYAVRRIVATLKKVGYSNIFARSPDSSNIGPKEWEKIISAINTWKKRKDILINMGDKNVKGIIITHGTDTISETALVLALEFTGTLKFPIVLASAYLPPGESGSDAVDNLLKAKRLAEDLSAPPLVYVVVGNNILLGSRVEKVRIGHSDKPGQYLVDYVGRVGYFDRDFNIHWEDGFREFADTLIRKKPQTTKKEEFGYVERLLFDNWTPADVLEDAIRRLERIKNRDVAGGVNRRYGLVLSGNFVKNKELEKVQELCASALKAGIPVFTGNNEVKQTLQESILLIDKSFRYPHARTKLTWLMRQGVSFDELEEELNLNYAGEIGGRGLPPERRRFTVNNYRPPHRTEVIVAFPGMEAEILSDALKRLLSIKAKTGRSVTYAFGDGNLPASNNDKIYEVVQAFLKKEFPFLAVRGLADFRNKKLFEVEQELSRALRVLPPERLKDVLSKFYIENPHKLVLSYIILHYPDAAKDLDLLKSRLREELPNIYVDKAEFEVNKVKFEEVLSKAKTTGKLKQLLSELDMTISPLAFIRYSRDGYTELSQRIIKEALMRYHPILYEIGRAVDSGIRVVIESTVAEFGANIRLYELGNMLLACGAEDNTSRWKNSPLRMFQKKQAPAVKSPAPVTPLIAKIARLMPSFIEAMVLAFVLYIFHAITGLPLLHYGSIAICIFPFFVWISELLFEAIISLLMILPVRLTTTFFLNREFYQEYYKRKPIERAELILENMLKKAKERGDIELLEVLSYVKKFRLTEQIPIGGEVRDIRTGEIYISPHMTKQPQLLQYFILRRARGLWQFDQRSWREKKMYYFDTMADMGDFMLRHSSYIGPFLYIYEILVMAYDRGRLRFSHRLHWDSPLSRFGVHKGFKKAAEGSIYTISEAKQEALQLMQTGKRYTARVFAEEFYFCPTGLA